MKFYADMLDTSDIITIGYLPMQVCRFVNSFSYVYQKKIKGKWPGHKEKNNVDK